MARPSGGIGEVEPFEQLDGPGAGVGRRQVEQLADQHEVLHAGEVLVDRGVLAGQADRLADLARLAGDVETGDPGRAGVGLEQRRQDADRGGLAGAVGPEDAEHGAGAGRQVDAVEGLGRAESLDEALGFDRVCR